MMDLKPCPFCGTAAVYYDAEDKTHARCPDEDCAGRVSWMPVDKWNCRPVAPSPSPAPLDLKPIIEYTTDHRYDIPGVARTFLMDLLAEVERLLKALPPEPPPLPAPSPVSGEGSKEWPLDDPKAMQTLQTGIEQAKRGEVECLGSFSDEGGPSPSSSRAPELTTKINLPRGFRWLRKGEVTRGSDYAVDLMNMQWVGLDRGVTVEKGDLFIRRKSLPS